MKRNKEQQQAFLDRLKELDPETLLREFQTCSNAAYYQKFQNNEGYENIEADAECYYQELLVRLSYKDWYTKSNESAKSLNPTAKNDRG